MSIVPTLYKINKLAYAFALEGLIPWGEEPFGEEYEICLRANKKDGTSPRIVFDSDEKEFFWPQRGYVIEKKNYFGLHAISFNDAGFSYARDAFIHKDMLRWSIVKIDRREILPSPANQRRFPRAWVIKSGTLAEVLFEVERRGVLPDASSAFVEGDKAMLKTKLFDAAEYLDSEEAIEEFLLAASEEGDPAYMEQAQSVVDRARFIHGLADALHCRRRDDCQHPDAIS